MRLSSQAVWSLAGSLAWLGAAVNAATDNVMEVDLVFPRPAESYAPTPYMPVVFALRNPKLAQYTDPYIDVRVSNVSKDGQWWKYVQRLDGANQTSDESYFVYTLLDTFAHAGHWNIAFNLQWYSCHLNPAGVFSGYKDERCVCQYSAAVEFFTKEGGKAIDLATNATNDIACAGEAVSVGNTPMQLNETWVPQQGTSSQCVLVSSIAAQALNDTKSCPVKIDSATAAAISANVTATTCAGPNPPSSCPPKSAAQRLAAVAGPACLAVAVGLFQLVA
jgi:hypothetical protein